MLALAFRWQWGNAYDGLARVWFSSKIGYPLLHSPQAGCLRPSLDRIEFSTAFCFDCQSSSGSSHRVFAWRFEPCLLRTGYRGYSDAEFARGAAVQRGSIYISG